VALASALGLPEAAAAAVRTAALLHDIGRVALPATVGQASLPASDDDVATWRMHVSVAEDVLNAVPGLATAAPIVAGMHERFDGTGYPLGRTGHAIPIAARVVKVVDAYDTFVSQRAFDGPMTHIEAITELVRRAGTQFDPDVVRAWVGVGDPEQCF
jgi:response regulator RpfG family c-di-GMP phosphodiesterase